VSEEIKPIQTWAVVELMGHIKTAGQVSEESHFGTVLLRLDIPQVNGNPLQGGVQPHTEFYGGSAIYRLTPCTEQVAHLVIQQNTSLPLIAYALPRPQFGQTTLGFREVELDEHFQDEAGEEDTA
jgi:hypothetical protein